MQGNMDVGYCPTSGKNARLACERKVGNATRGVSDNRSVECWSSSSKRASDTDAFKTGRAPRGSLRPPAGTPRMPFTRLATPRLPHAPLDALRTPFAPMALILAFALILAATLTLSGCMGCVDVHGDPPSKREVMAYVREACPTEGFELLNVSQTGKEPAEFTYTFRSTERNLTFTARSYLRQMYFDASPLGWYEPSVSCDYVDRVHDVYNSAMEDNVISSGLYATYDADGSASQSQDGSEETAENGSGGGGLDAAGTSGADEEGMAGGQASGEARADDIATEEDDSTAGALDGVDDVLAGDAIGGRAAHSGEATPYVRMGWLFIRGEEDFDAAAQCLAQMSDLYAQETAYNDQNWLSDNPYDRVYVCYLPTFTCGMPYADTYGDVSIASFAIDGTLEEETVHQVIQQEYAQLVVDGAIDDALPSGLEETLHKSTLTTYVNGSELAYDRDAAPNDAAAAGCGLFAGSEDAYWSDALGCYAMRVDVGYVASNADGVSSVRCCVFPWFSQDGTWQAELQTSGLTGKATFSTEYVSLTGTAHVVTVQHDGEGVPLRMKHKAANGQAVDLAFDTLETTDTINSYYTVGISIEDFAALFDFSYEVDEEQGTVSFAY